MRFFFLAAVLYVWDRILDPRISCSIHNIVRLAVVYLFPRFPASWATFSLFTRLSLYGIDYFRLSGSNINVEQETD